MGVFHAGILANFVVTTQLPTDAKPSNRCVKSSSQPPSAAMDTKNLNPQLGLNLSRRDGGGYHRLTSTSFQNNASKEKRNATGA
jgi:hypothetical protein